MQTLHVGQVVAELSLSLQRELLALLASKAAPCLPLTAKQVHQQQPVHAAVSHMERGRPAAV